MFLRQIWNDAMALKESFYVVLLNNSKKVVGYYRVSIGGSTATIVDVKDIFRPAILSACESIIVAHNHPSGRMEASKADINITKRIKESGEMLGIPLDDHIILSPQNGYYSMRSREGI